MNARRTKDTLVVAITLLAVALLACKKIARQIARENTKDEGTVTAPVTPAVPQGATPGAPTAPVVQRPGNHFTDDGAAKKTVDALAAKIGGSPVRVLELLIYDTYAMIEAQDPKNKENVDEYKMMAGKLQGPVPVRLTGSEKKLEPNLYDLDDIALEKIPELVKDTLQRAKFENGEVTHVIIKKPRPSSKDARIRVYVRSPRKSGRVEYDPKGSFTKEYLD